MDEADWQGPCSCLPSDECFQSHEHLEKPYYTLMAAGFTLHVRDQLFGLKQGPHYVGEAGRPKLR